jgi:hypothetical protein
VDWSGRKQTSVCKPNCKPTVQHSMIRDITNRDHRIINAKSEHTLNHWTARANTRILELENRRTGNRTVGSNPTLSAKNSYSKVARLSPRGSFGERRPDAGAEFSIRGFGGPVRCFRDYEHESRSACTGRYWFPLASAECEGIGHVSCGGDKGQPAALLHVHSWRVNAVVLP